MVSSTAALSACSDIETQPDYDPICVDFGRKNEEKEQGEAVQLLSLLRCNALPAWVLDLASI
jgi:hypothetical protein